MNQPRQSGGKEEQFETLMAEVRDDLWGFLYNRVRNQSDAEDLFQEICLKAYSHMDQLRDPRKSRSWLFSVALNSVRSFFRKKRPQPLTEVEEANLITEQDPVGNMHQEKRLHHLRECILNLPERDRDLILLDIMAEWGQAEIADKFGLNTNTVKTILRRARIKLARAMAEGGYE